MEIGIEKVEKRQKTNTVHGVGDNREILTYNDRNEIINKTL